MRYRSRFSSRSALSLHALALAVAMAAMTSTHAQAEEGAGPSWTFGGFGTVGVAHSDYDQADYTSTILKGKGAGASDKWSHSLDTRLGAQLGVTLDKRWSGVLQVVSEQRYNGSYKPSVEWVNIKYQATPDLALRVGRIALPIFLAADYRKAGYAIPWVRTPVEVYGGVPISNNDGADLVYRWQSGGVKHVTQAFYGKTHIHLTESTHVKARAIAGLTHTIEHGPLTLRASAFRATLNTDILRELFDAYRQFGPQGVAIAEKYDVIDKRMEGVAIGFNYDPGQWFLTAEGGTMNGHSFLGRSRGMFASAGYRYSAFTPYLMYSRTDPRSPTSDPGLSLAGLPPAYAYVAMQLNAGLEETLKTRASQTSVSAGMRWDFRPDMAFKVQYDRVVPRDGTRGTLINLEPGFKSGTPVHVTSAVLDVVF